MPYDIDGSVHLKKEEITNEKRKHVKKEKGPSHCPCCCAGGDFLLLFFFGLIAFLHGLSLIHPCVTEIFNSLLNIE